MFPANPNAGAALGGRLTAAQEYEQAFRTLRERNEQTIETVDRLERLRQINGLDALINATAPGMLVEATTMTREQFLVAVALNTSLRTWLNTPIGPGLPSPLQAIYARDAALPPAAGT